jgi:hypothetical protein
MEPGRRSSRARYDIATFSLDAQPKLAQRRLRRGATTALEPLGVVDIAYVEIERVCGFSQSDGSMR